VIPINFDEVDDPAEMIIASTQHRGVDASIDAIGFETKGSTLETIATTLKIEASAGTVLRWAIAATRRGGGVVRRAGPVCRLHSRVPVRRRFRQGTAVRDCRTDDRTSLASGLDARFFPASQSIWAHRNHAAAPSSSALRGSGDAEASAE
jgi:threonine dehydrogenase-like Zn-dependent dehydrogenase